jgi:MOSC domain-containing protein YiiM
MSNARSPVSGAILGGIERLGGTASVIKEGHVSKGLECKLQHREPKDPNYSV